MANSKFGKDFFILSAYFLIIDICIAIYLPFKFTKINSDNIGISGLVIFFISDSCVILFLFIRNMIFLYQNEKENNDFGNQFLNYVKKLKLSVDKDDLSFLKKIFFKDMSLSKINKWFLLRLMINGLQNQNNENIKNDEDD